jgi:hypothetical protein
MITNIDYINNSITNNGEKGTVPYRWSHGATDLHLGDGLVIYSLIQYMRAKVCVCLGSGGGFIPRIMTQARKDLHSQKIFEGNSDTNWGDIGVTYIVDAMNGVGGEVNWSDGDSYFRSNFYPRIIKDTTSNAFHNFFVLQDIKIDYLHIDAGHSYENVKEDFELYSTIMSPNGIISIHDTDTNYENHFIVTEDAKPFHIDWTGPAQLVNEIDRDKFEVFNMFNFGVVKNKPASTGITLIRKK